LVQTDAAGGLPQEVAPIVRPICAGTRRALEGLRPVRDVTLFHGLDVDVPIHGPDLTVSTVHDLSFFDAPWAYGRYRRRGERLLLRHAIRRADAVIAVSQFTADRLAHWFGREAIVIPLAPGRWAHIPSEGAIASVIERYELPDRFLLHVATAEPRKDIALVAEAASRLDLPLVLAGSGTKGATYRHAIGLGFVPTEDLPALYNAATAVMYCSRYEGFGLPPVEAMACGGAVVASAVGALPQVSGEGAVLVRRHDPEAWVRALSSVVEDESARNELRRGAREAVSGLSWKATARQTLEVYRSVGLDV
jgi:glycosyltransferase involved in cell wall biosynthesis